MENNVDYGQDDAYYNEHNNRVEYINKYLELTYGTDLSCAALHRNEYKASKQSTS